MILSINKDTAPNIVDQYKSANCAKSLHENKTREILNTQFTLLG